MRLVVIGGYSLDVLQRQVIKSFSDIPSKGLKASWDKIPESPFKDVGMPFAESSLKKIYHTAPVKDLHGLSITWQIPPQLGNWKSKPCDYLSHLIGHEAQGSLLAALKLKGWANACCAGVGAEGYEVRHVDLSCSRNIYTSSNTLSTSPRMPLRTPSSLFPSRYRRKGLQIGVKLFPCCIVTLECLNIIAEWDFQYGFTTS
jgi:hypothetical protein